MKDRLAAMGLIPTPEGERQARKGRDTILARILHDLICLTPGDLLTVLCVTSGLVYDAQSAALVARAGEGQQV